MFVFFLRVRDNKRLKTCKARFLLFTKIFITFILTYLKRKKNKGLHGFDIYFWRRPEETMEHLVEIGHVHYANEA